MNTDITFSVGSMGGGAFPSLHVVLLFVRPFVELWEEGLSLE
jgi:hypothetical protein